MSELSPEARALMHSGRSLGRPTAEDRKRIHEALRAKLGADALPIEAAIADRAAPWRPSAQLISGVVAGAFVLTGALFFALRPSAPVAPRSPAPVVVPAVAAPSAPSEQPAPLADSPAEALPPLSSSSPALAPPLSSTKPNGRPAQESLAQEVALLSLATSALNAGRPAEALKRLNEHARKFPNGLLSEERRAARAQALCLVGRTAEGQAELSRLVPQSPAAARAKQVCSR